MDTKLVLKRWLAAFAGDVDKDFLEQHVLARGNYLWHVFSWEKSPCLRGEEARAAFNALQYDKAVMFESGFAWVDNRLLQAEAAILEALRYTNKISAEELDECGDTYVVAEDFSWTYVHTHEEMCGPYFARTGLSK